MNNIIDGKKIAQKLKDNLKLEINTLKQKYKKVHVAKNKQLKHLANW